MSVGASTSISEKIPGSTRSRAASAAPSSVRSIGEPPEPPTRSGHPKRIQPASKRIAFTRCICAMWSSSVPGAAKEGASSAPVGVQPLPQPRPIIGEAGGTVIVYATF